MILLCRITCYQNSTLFHLSKKSGDNTISRTPTYCWSALIVFIRNTCWPPRYMTPLQNVATVTMTRTCSNCSYFPYQNPRINDLSLTSSSSYINVVINQLQHLQKYKQYCWDFNYKKKNVLINECLSLLRGIMRLADFNHRNSKIFSTNPCKKIYL